MVTQDYLAYNDLFRRYKGFSILKIFTFLAFALIAFCLQMDSFAQNLCNLPEFTPSTNTKESNPLPQSFTSTEGRFKIGLPPVAKPKTDTNRTTGAKKISYNWFTLNRGRFEVSYFDSDKKLDDSAVSKTILDNLRNLLLSKGGKLESEKDFTLNSHPARETRIKSESGININRFYLVESRLYSVSLFLPSKLECALEESTKVIDTFELIKNDSKQ